MGILTRLFGQKGKVRFTFTTTTGEEYTAKMEVEMFNIGESELKEKLKEIVFVELGKRVSTIKIIGFVEY